MQIYFILKWNKQVLKQARGEDGEKGRRGDIADTNKNFEIWNLAE